MQPALQKFRELFQAMDTPLLLERYRRGGMVPEAAAALLSVLEERGYPRETLDTIGDAIKPVPNIEFTQEEPARITFAGHPLQALKRRMKRIRWTLLVMVIPVLLAFLLLALPIVGNFVVLGFASAMGCSTGENMVHSCMFMGKDIGNFIYGYVVDIFVLGLFNPFFAASAMMVFLKTAIGIAWMLAVLSLIVVWFTTRRRLREFGA